MVALPPKEGSLRTWNTFVCDPFHVNGRLKIFSFIPDGRSSSGNKTTYIEYTQAFQFKIWWFLSIDNYFYRKYFRVNSPMQPSDVVLL